jgi:hypothetical protein
VQQVKDRLLGQKLQQVPEVLREDLKVALHQAENQRTEIQKYLVSKLGPLVNISDEEITAALTEEEKKKWEQLNQEEMKISQSVPADGAERLLALEDICWAILNTNEFLFQH